MSAQESHYQADTTADRGGVVVLIVLCLATFSGGMNSMGLQPFLVEIGDDLESTVPAVGQAVTVTLLMSAATALLAGPIADHFGHRRLMVGGALILALSAIGTSLAVGYFTFLGSRLAGGASLALLNGLSLAIAGSYFTGQARRRALSVTIAAMSGTPILGVPLLSVAGDLFGWRWAFGALGLTALLLALLIARAIPHEVKTGRPFTLLGILHAYAPVLGQRSTLALYAGSLLRAISWLGITTFFGAFLIQQHDYSIRQVGLAYMIGGAGFLLGSLSAGGRIGSLSPRALFVGVTVLAGFFFGSSYVFEVSAAVAIMLLTAGGYFGAIGWVALNTMLANESQAGAGTTMSLNTAVFHLGSASGGAVGGMLLAIGDYTTLGLTLPLFALASSLIVWHSGRLQEQPEPAELVSPVSRRPE